MSTENDQNNGNEGGDQSLSTDPQGGTPDGQQQDQNEPRGLSGSGLRYGANDDVPTWAVGKTADEILQMTQTLYNEMQTGGTPQGGQPAHQTVEQPVTSSVPQVDPNLMYRDPVAYQEAVEARARAIAREEIQQASGSITSPMASMARTQAKTHRPDVWAAYEPEIEAVMKRVPDASKADVSLWQEAVDLIAGRHVDDIAQRRAREIIERGDTGMMQTEGTMISPAGATLSPIRQLFADSHEAVQAFRDEGLTADDVITYALKRGHTEEKYADMLQRKTSRRVGA